MSVLKLLPLPHFAGLSLPAYQSAAAAGLDIPAAVAEPLIIEPGSWAAIPTGLCVEMEPGYEAQIRPRSGLAAKHGVTVLNSPGTIDADYRGELKILLINHGDKPFPVQRGERIAQMVIAAVERPHIQVAERLSDTERGAGGFGSTGSK